MITNALLPSLIAFGLIMSMDLALEAIGHYKACGLKSMRLLPESCSDALQLSFNAIIYILLGLWIYNDGLFGGIYLPELCALQCILQALHRFLKIKKSNCTIKNDEVTPRGGHQE